MPAKPFQSDTRFYERSYRTWGWDYNYAIKAIDPNNPTVIRGPLFTQMQQPYSGQTWIQRSILTTVVSPFVQYDWPNPRTYPRPDYTWIQGFQTTLVPSPFVQVDWPNPRPITWYQTWIEAGNNFPPIPVVKPFLQSDYPNPQPVMWYQWWSQSPAQPLPQKPFFNFDWPLPRTYQPIDQTYYLSSVLGPLGFIFMPFSNEWALTPDNIPIDQTWIQGLLNLFPPPPPPLGPATGGRQISEEEVDALRLASHKWQQKIIDACRFNADEGMDVNIHSLGGIARAKSLTQQQRTSIATKAAQARWQK